MSRITIPTEWTPEEALTVAYFLESIMLAIWETHGDQMSRQLQVVLKQGCLSAQRDDPDDPDDHDPDFPF